MTELQIRNKVVDTIKSWLGAVQGDTVHKKIIDTYNAHQPRARGYKVQYTDAWCATTVSTVAILCKLTDIMPLECGCEPMIELYKEIGRWQEKDSYIPKLADVIFYDWQDNGVGDCIGRADHVGIVEKVVDGAIYVLEGNGSGGKVIRRVLAVGARYIRGYGVPDYASKATKAKKKKPVLDKTGFKMGNKSRGVLTLKQLLLIAYDLKMVTIKVKNNEVYGKRAVTAVNQLLKKWGNKPNGTAGKNFIKKLTKKIRKEMQK